MSRTVVDVRAFYRNKSLIFFELLIIVFLFFFFSFLSLKATSADVGANGTSISELEIGTSSPIINSIDIDGGTISLTPNDTKAVNCSVNITDYDGDTDLVNVTAEFFDNTVSFYGDTDDNNYHYTNSSCFINVSYGGASDALASCFFDVYYYANSGVWNCTTRVTDQSNLNTEGSDVATIQTLLAVALPDTIDYGLVNATEVSDQNITNVTNVGNVKINLSLHSYGSISGDNLSMNCSLGNNISADYQKFNLTTSNPGILNLSSFENLYVNLTGSPVTKKFDLNFRQNDVTNEASNRTYWRIYVPKGSGGTCQGNLVFGAIQASES